jgi:hypothetical protein
MTNSTFYQKSLNDFDYYREVISSLMLFNELAYDFIGTNLQINKHVMIIAIVPKECESSRLLVNLDCY